MAFSVGTPQCYVDIYPYEAASISLPQSAIQDVTVEKDIGEAAGTFMITLVPGGPLGVNMSPSWAEIITPMSLAVIAMQRDEAAAVVMVGIVRSCGYEQVTQPNEQVVRNIVITGVDFSYFFNMFTWYSLWYLGALGVGAALPGQSQSSALPALLGAGLLSGDPGQIGTAWFTKVMAGDQGVLSKTLITFKNAKVTFTQAMASFFENYDVTVPYGDTFVTGEGAWIDKFKQIFPFPFYEFFVITTPSIDLFSAGNGSGTGGYSFQSSGLRPEIAGHPMVVARRNPLPQLTANGASLGNIDTSLWDRLPLYTMQTDPIRHQVSFDESQVFNFYTMNPTWMSTSFGQQTDSIVPFIYSYGALGDVDSIKRYGYRPQPATTNWLANQKDTQQVADLSVLISTLVTRFASFWQPTPLMAKGSATTWLRPDIMPGSRFRYTPFKNGKEWDFYITGVQHSYSFGGPSTTTLKLARGLPRAVYANPSLLTAVHTGAADRQNGAYFTRSGATALAPVPLDQFQTFLSQLGPPYTAPQTP